MKEQLLNEIENIKVKVQIVHYRAIYPFVTMFSQKPIAAEVSESVCMWESDDR